jgi:hypothetical protein
MDFIDNIIPSTTGKENLQPSGPPTDRLAAGSGSTASPHPAPLVSPGASAAGKTVKMETPVILRKPQHARNYQ